MVLEFSNKTPEEGPSYTSWATRMSPQSLEQTTSQSSPFLFPPHHCCLRSLVPPHCVIPRGTHLASLSFIPSPFLSPSTDPIVWGDKAQTHNFCLGPLCLCLCAPSPFPPWLQPPSPFQLQLLPARPLCTCLWLLPAPHS